MYEYGGQWELEGPDGTILVFNDQNSGLWLEEASGFDSPTIRTSVEDLPERDGAVFGDSYYGRRPWTLSGTVVGITAEARNAAFVKMQRALRGLRSDFTLRTTASGLPPMQATGRIEALRWSGGFAKRFQISGVCADPRFYSQTLHEEIEDGTVGQVGAAFPWSFPVNFGGTSGATVQVTIANAGNFDAPALLRVHGPLTNPQIDNATTGESVYVDTLTLASGEYLDIDTGARTVEHSNGNTYYDRVRFPGSSWWLLAPGSNIVRLWGSGAGDGTELQVQWRDAWV